jgi:hypothetical protein
MDHKWAEAEELNRWFHIDANVDVRDNRGQFCTQTGTLRARTFYTGAEVKKTKKLAIRKVALCNLDEPRRVRHTCSLPLEHR